jgi:hypothetical protein
MDVDLTPLKRSLDEEDGHVRVSSLSTLPNRHCCAGREESETIILHQLTYKSYEVSISCIIFRYRIP